VRQADVEALPYPDESFDTVLNTMAFSGYPNGSGDLIRDMDALFREAGLDYWKEPIGGSGSIQLYVATKP